ncbi:hypothetical protein PV11_01346 [Exophiala sideris]|uniref:C2H2-type domain-containing protein n=1 Tax=Exophiala sideris TaxID=1016849 RepID=A0A0D1YVX0_9EURO|nr:hypothetical protein PV11_01346 [Exophiala sideris]
MDIRRPHASAAGRKSSYTQDAAAPGTTSRSNSQTSEEGPKEGLLIPGVRFDDPPPPLPPPRYNEELAQGIDLAWTWGNSDPFKSERRLAPINPGSSLYRGYMESRRNSGRSEESENVDMDDDYYRRGSTVSTVRSPSQADIRAGFHVPHLVRKPPSPPSTNQRLQGEVPLAQQNFNLSAQAYDQRLLSKIGKPSSPSHPSRRSGSAESTSISHQLPIQTRDSRLQPLSTNEVTSVPFDPISRWITSPASAGASPGSRPGWRDYNMDHRSPSIESAAASLVLDPELFVHSRLSGLHSTSASVVGVDDLASLASRSQRGSYEHGMFLESDIDIAGDESGGFRNLHLGDSQQQPGRRSPKQGMKRRALSPPSDVARDDKSPSRGTSVVESFPKFHATMAARSSVSRYQPKHGSVSSTASSARQNSYASSISLSIAASSMTSISSFDKQSPLDPSQAAYITSAHPVSSPATSITPARKQPPQPSIDTRHLHGKMSIQSAISDNMLPPVTRIGNSFICDCCPKKPKKFDTEDELRAHQMEKQYACQYCNNRFKNKNEAERHQNSLHLRRYSWSCAAIVDYRTVFHPVPPTPPSAAGIAQCDACGYCGEEFANMPQPDWNRRLDHLTSVHKFGECNQAKKFYRADHFRQHLKHSHAGSSGKWTNMLEAVCLREESASDSAGISPTGSESSPGRGPSSLPDPPMGGATISESCNET